MQEYTSYMWLQIAFRQVLMTFITLTVDANAIEYNILKLYAGWNILSTTIYGSKTVYM